jgi:serine/threonine protein kinase
VASGTLAKGDKCGVFRLEALIGKGQFGSVYRATRQPDGAAAAAAAVVAIKAVDRERAYYTYGRIDAYKMQMLRHEIQVMQTLPRHPNIVHLLEPLYSATHVYHLNHRMILIEHLDWLRFTYVFEIPIRIVNLV